MQIIFLPTLWTVLLDSLIWALVQPLIAYFAVRLPLSFFNPQDWLFRTHRWERDGAIYQQLLRIRSWKGRLPSGGPVFKEGFSMKKLRSFDLAYLERWLLETCRAELTHWSVIAISPLFFLWNPPLLGWMMMLYAVLANLPCILVQRYNRPHLKRILARRSPSAG